MPFLDGVVFSEQMESDIRIMQSALRADRLDPNNPTKVASIVIPVLMTEDFGKQEGGQAFVHRDGEYVNETDQKRQTDLCKRLNFATVKKVLEELSQHDECIGTRIVVKEARSLLHQHIREDTSDTEKVKQRHLAQELRNKELNEMVKNLMYRFINRGDLTHWTVPHFVQRVKSIAGHYQRSVYNEETYQDLCEYLTNTSDGASTELPRQSPTVLFKPYEFSWQMVDERSTQYYATAQECQAAVEQLDEDEFEQHCEEDGIEPTAFATLSRVNHIYHEMDSRVPVGLSERYYLRKMGDGPLEFVVDGVDM